MTEKINIAELLKDCPSGLELNCTMYEDLYFDYVDELNNIRCYIQQKFNKTSVVFNQDGTPNSHTKSKCVIFPKDKTTWEGFVPPCKFKDGDVLFVDCSDDEEDKSYQYIFILNKPEFLGKWHSYCMLDGVGNFQLHETYLTDEEYHPRFATEEEKQKLFQAIKNNGYNWNAETKTLQKLVEPKFKEGNIIQDITGICKVKITEVNVEDECYLYKSLNINGIGSITFNRQDDWELVKDNPKFKVGDRVRNKNYKDYIYDIHDITDKGYRAKEINADSSIIILFGSQEDNYELVPNKFDVTTLKPFDKVLVRHNKDNKWCASFFSHIDGDFHSHCYKYVTIAGKSYPMCIPYDGNEHLLGTTNDCDEYFKNW